MRASFVTLAALLIFGAATAYAENDDENETPPPRPSRPTLDTITDGTSRTIMMEERIVDPGDSDSETQNEIVPARRGRAPADFETDANAQDQIIGPNNRTGTRRDHRTRRADGNQTNIITEEETETERMRREAEELEKQLKELEEGGGN